MSSDEASTPDLTETQVIIIGCVCAGILIVLLVILFYIICRRKLRNKNNYANDPHSSRTIPQGNGTLANQKSHSYDNQGHLLGSSIFATSANPDSTASNSSSDQDDVLVSSRNGFGQYHPHGGENYPQGGEHYPQGGEHYPMTNTSYDDSFSFDKQYEYDMNRRNANVNNDPYYNDKQGDISFSGSPRTPTKDPQQFMTVPEEKHEGGSFGSGQESGYSTPDQTKPKKTWRFRPPMLNFLPQHRPGRKKHLRANPDMVPYSHDPPGHTCGLPCCSEDLQIQLRIRRQPKSCIGIQEHDVAQQNFTFKGRQSAKARPELLNGFFSVQQPKEQRRGEIPKFGTLRGTRMSRIAEEQQTNNFLKGREITLPESDDPYATEKLYLDNFSNGESDDILEGVSDSEIEYYMTVKGPCDMHRGGIKCQSGAPSAQQLYPWQMLQEMKYNSAHMEAADDTGSSSDYYEVLRYPDDTVIKSSDAAEFSNVILTNDKNIPNQFHRTVPLPPVPPRPPKRTKLNHPPLNKNSISSSERSDSLYATPPKYNTYSSVHSINSMQEKAARDLHERYLSLDRLYDSKKSFHRDARDIDFSGRDVPSSANRSVQLGTLSKQKFKKILQKNEYITENLKADFRKMDTNVKNGEMNDSDKSTITETGSTGSAQLINQGQQEVKLGISNPAFRHADVDGKVIGTRHLDIEGRLLGTRSLGGYGRMKPSPGDLEQKLLKGRSLAGYGRTSAFDENPITLIL